MSLLYERRGDTKRLAVILDDGLWRYQTVDETNKTLAQPGDCYLVKIAARKPAIAAFFVKMGGGQEGFLPFSEVPEDENPAPGDLVIAQVRRPAEGGKAAKLSLKPEWTGQYLRYQPLSKCISAERRVKDKDLRKSLRDRVRALTPPAGGLIVHEAATEAMDSALAEELAQLAAHWQLVKEAAQGQKEPGLLSAWSPVDSFLADWAQKLSVIITNVPDEVASRAERAGLAVRPHPAPFDGFQVEAQMKQACARRVTVKGGVTVVIDRTEAFTAVDINSASLMRPDRDSHLAANLLAAAALPRLLSLRGTGGAVVIDFINLKDKAARQQVLDALDEAFQKDPVKTALHGFTALGHVEMSRQKRQEEAAFGRAIPCPTCSGSGLIDEETPHA